jgi:hypothetical protein
MSLMVYPTEKIKKYIIVGSNLSRLESIRVLKSAFLLLKNTHYLIWCTRLKRFKNVYYRGFECRHVEKYYIHRIYSNYMYSMYGFDYISDNFFHKLISLPRTLATSLP